MQKYYLVCYRENIENLINDEDIFFDGVDMNEDVDAVFEVFAENEDDAKKQYLRVCAEYTYEIPNRMELIGRECAARAIRRIVAGELMLLPREVLACENISQILTKTYDAVAKQKGTEKLLYTKDVFKKIAEEIDVNEIASMLDKESMIALYMDLYEKDVFVQEMIT